MEAKEVSILIINVYTVDTIKRESFANEYLRR